MRKIPKTFKKGNYTYNLIKRKGNIALYEQLSCFSGTPDYEIHKVRYFKAHTSKYKQPDGTHKEVIREEGDYLAGTSEFGQYGWSCQSLEMANKIFDEQVKLEKQNGK